MESFFSEVLGSFSSFSRIILAFLRQSNKQKFHKVFGSKRLTTMEERNYCGGYIQFEIIHNGEKKHCTVSSYSVSAGPNRFFCEV